MKILLLGVGMQGKAALYDLDQHDEVTEIVAADRDLEALQEHIARRGYGSKVRSERLNAADSGDLDRLFKQGADVAINLLPTQFDNAVASAAIRHGIHMAFTSYTTPEINEMADEAAAMNITILPEFGLDPGIDLVMLGHAVRSLDTVEEILCYGAGIPDSEAAGNSIKYKISWTFEGVLNSYRRAASLISSSKVVHIGGTEIFAPDNIHMIDIPGIGSLEAYPNGDALPYAGLLGIDPSTLHNLGRYSMRWPGHCAFWKSIVDLHLLDDDPVRVDGQAVNPLRFMNAALAPHLQYAGDERDVTIVRVDVKGVKNGEQKHLVYQMVDKRDMQTGFMSMSRTVGFTVTIGALMIGSGQLTKRGLISPVNDIPFDQFAQKLATRNIKITVDEIS